MKRLQSLPAFSPGGGVRCSFLSWALISRGRRLSTMEWTLHPQSVLFCVKRTRVLITSSCRSLFWKWPKLSPRLRFTLCTCVCPWVGSSLDLPFTGRQGRCCPGEAFRGSSKHLFPPHLKTEAGHCCFETLLSFIQQSSTEMITFSNFIYYFKKNGILFKVGNLGGKKWTIIWEDKSFTTK